ncbi:hypothetical protein A2483_01940 [Candidatus Peregrinibacteria bacterium RIFOXYC2_FULL_33_13]|nr:MAG: Septum formation initiator [Candidatus Peregrinibacteria bacterium GW2011_GWA2_33_10]KKP41189.1 MAG: hypothetical protein UR30_C0001G0036 [Candidatus Peregrinibacteria bacterium GW2011_GWC2_33_13]OGJ49709.1 MAG: hypothetical protein A2229_01060 [Candidatus Peregrinibacteria bacterium RIFOXYA2_FULL_33_7]OGJ52921.1 MAG: hypothetical protein A2483_01940 [Candidatus Peregrinibacteria bacterium RIFOXYC2_FULL_33_13]
MDLRTQRYSHSPTNSAKIVILLGFILILYMLYALTTKIYDNYLIDQHIKTFTTKNKNLLSENSKKLEDYQYYTSDAYIEKTAKQSLSLINPGEKVIIITENSNPTLPESELLESEKIERMKKMPNYKKWWNFFFIENQFK